MQPEEQAEIIRRLRSAEGRLKKVARLLEADPPYEQVLHRLGAVRDAVRDAGAWLVDCQINSNEEVIRHNANPEDRAAAMTQLLNLYTLAIRYSNHLNKERDE